MNSSDISKLNQQFSNASVTEVLQYFITTYKDRIALASSMGAEDQVLTAMIAGIDKSCRIFTLDTGRVFPETYSTIEKTRMQYGIDIDIFFPDTLAIENMVNEKGINLFYESIENRKLCCHVRKLEPLKRAFKGLEVWICGLRKEQSVTRTAINMIEWDEGNQLIKINPLINWTEAKVWDYIRRNAVPYNKLHDNGFPSIGCQPCTRAVKAGEDLRAGRWWWENPESKECGLHVKEKL
ncbi:MAG: phosphoadenylyl-sulfate reductase [Bacteroidetes bacterium]|nr:phosphoadenylyl-sulfate reductase [Bacteroidota bacterium]